MSSRVILASAGSGKTFQLAQAYLALLARGQAPSSLLATTFTRKAAGEILQRVLQHLLEAAERGDAAAHGAASRDAATTRDAAAAAGDTAAAARALLGRFARDLPHGRVQTLDAFFVRLATRFAQEFGLPPGFRLGSEPELAALRAQAVSRALQGAPAREMAELLRQVQRDGAGRRVHETLLDVVQEGHELLLDSAPEAWTPLCPSGQCDEGEIEAALADLEAADLPLTAKGKPHVIWEKARVAVCVAVGSKDWELLLCQGLVFKLLTVGSYGRHDFPPGVRAALEPLARHAQAVLLTELMAAGRAFRHLLERYDAALAQCQRASGVYGFSDLTRLLRGRLALDGAATALRDEGRLSHLLLDEFQDTSVAQWRVLAPLVESCLSARDEGRSLFCVGDVKQSIYGWRQGEPELLLALSRRPGIVPEALDESRRSAQVVLDAVNTVFAGLPARAVFAVEDEQDRAALVAAAGNWTALFRPHRAHDPALPGCVSLRQVALPAGADGDSEARRRAVLDAACAHVAKLAAAAPGARIGILVRGRAAIGPLILGLRARGVHACGEGGNQLTDSAAVLAALSLLALADHPDDTAAAFHVATSPLAPELGISPEQASEPALASDEDATRRAAGQPRLAAAAALRVRLQRDGFGRVLAAWSALVAAAPGFSAWDRARFAQLVDLGFAHDARAGLRIDDFVALVREQRVEDPGSAPVRVLTVHGAKGLEYDAVVLPDLDYQLPRPAGAGSRFLSSRSGIDGVQVAAGPVTAVLRRPRKDLRVLHPLIAELEGRALRRAMEEQLSVLYVALTRAKVRLDVFIEAPRDKCHQPACRFGELLRECFADPFAEPRPDGVLFTAGDERAAWPPRGAGAVDSVAASAAPPATVGAATSLGAAFDAGSRRLPKTRSPSDTEHAVARNARELLAGRPHAALGRGLILHRLCELIEWLPGDGAPGAGVPPAETLLSAARQVVAKRGLLIEDAALARVLADFEGLLTTAVVRTVFGRPEKSPSGATPELWQERRFAVSDADGELLRGVFDRVVIWRAGDLPVAAEIIDFKSDAPPTAAAGDVAEWLAERVARYTPQMRDYRSALARLIGLPPERIACRLLFLLADAVRDVAPES